jgi:uncharacterized membrane protein YfcA
VSIEQLISYAVVLIVGVFAGIVNTLAGGGSLVTLPLLIFMGLTPSEANGTNRVAVWVQCVSAVMGFRQKGVSNFRVCILLAIPATIGAIIGAQFSVELPDEVFKKIIAVVMLLVVALIVFKPKSKTQSEEPITPNYWLASLVFFGIGFYGGFIQAGVGYLLMFGLTTICRFDLVNTAAAKVFIVAAYTSFAVLVFIINGLIDWQFAIALSIGNGIGGYLGSSLAVKRGENLIRWVLVVTVVVMSLKLLGILPAF